MMNKSDSPKKPSSSSLSRRAVKNNTRLLWSAGGESVEEGNYQLTIVVTAEDDTLGTWLIDINIDLP